MPDKTHREVKKASISARYLAEYMAANGGPRRTILRNCKYISLARAMNHQDATAYISTHLSIGIDNEDAVRAKSQMLRDTPETSDFNRSVLDVNADYLDQFAEIQGGIDCLKFQHGYATDYSKKIISGVIVRPEIRASLLRITKTNKVRLGAFAVRYSKGKALKEDVAHWQSAFMHGYLRDYIADDGQYPEPAMCLTLDVYTGDTYDATSKAVSMYKSMTAELQTIADAWDNIQPPENAIL